MTKTITLDLSEAIWSEIRRKAIHETNSTNPNESAVIEKIIRNYFLGRQRD